MNAGGLWFLYLVIIVLAFILFFFVLRWGLAWSIFIALVIGLLVVLIFSSAVTFDSAEDKNSVAALMTLAFILALIAFFFVLIRGAWGGNGCAVKSSYACVGDVCNLTSIKANCGGDVVKMTFQ